MSFVETDSYMQGISDLFRIDLFRLALSDPEEKVDDDNKDQDQNNFQSLSRHVKHTSLDRNMDSPHNYRGLPKRRNSMYTIAEKTSLDTALEQVATIPEEEEKQEPPTPKQNHSCHRCLLLQEISESEGTYIEFLKVISELYLHKLQTAAKETESSFVNAFVSSLGVTQTNTPSQAMIDDMFPLIDRLLELHEKEFQPRLNRLVRDLETPEDDTENQKPRRLSKLGKSASMADITPRDKKVDRPVGDDKTTPAASEVAPDRVVWQVDALAQFFISQGELLMTYADHVNRLERAFHLIAHHLDKEPFASIHAEGLADPRCKGQAIQSLMIMPLQRVTRYHLFLTQMCRYMEGKGQSFAKLVEARDLLKKVDFEINECKRKSELRGRAKQLMETLANNYGYVQADALLAVPRTYCCGGSYQSKLNSDEVVDFHILDNTPVVVVAVAKPSFLISYSNAVYICCPNEITVLEGEEEKNVFKFRLSWHSGTPLEFTVVVGSCSERQELIQELDKAKANQKIAGKFLVEETNTDHT